MIGIKQSFSVWSDKETMGFLLCHDQKIYETCFGRCRINFYLLQFAPDFQFDWQKSAQRVPERACFHVFDFYRVF